MRERTKLLLAVLVGLLLALGGLAAWSVHRTNQAYADHERDNPDRRLARIADGARAYYEAEHVTAQGVVLPPQFPGDAPVTPAASPCDQGDLRYAPDPQRWVHPTWQALHFAVDQPHPYRYAFVAGPTGFTARALGDLDCDGRLSTFERVGTVDAHGALQITTYRHDELE